MDRPAPAELSLRDGTRVLVRPIRPEDKALLAEGFERLSPQSRYRRFFSAMTHLSEKQLAYFTEVDYVDHFAWVAFDLDQPDQPGIGVARYIRLRDDPEAADVALAVVDDHQGRGLGGILLALLAERARECGIRRFVGNVLVDNEPMITLFDELGGVRRRDEPGVYEVTVDLPTPEVPLAETPMYDRLRDAARRRKRDRDTDTDTDVDLDRDLD